jgi:hypothetical protein
MGSDPIDLYASQVGGIANEMLEYLQPEDRNHLERLVLKPATLANLLSYDDKALKKACVMLGSGPSQSRKAIETLRAREPMFLLQVILTANALGALAQQSLEDERGHSGYIGWSYRKVARDLAEHHVSQKTGLKKRMTEKIRSLLYYDDEVQTALDQFERRMQGGNRPVEVQVAAKNITNVDLTAIKLALETNLAFAREAYAQAWDEETANAYSRAERDRRADIYSNAEQALVDLKALAIDLDREDIFSLE